MHSLTSNKQIKHDRRWQWFWYHILQEMDITLHREVLWLGIFVSSFVKFVGFIEIKSDFTKFRADIWHRCHTSPLTLERSRSKFKVICFETDPAATATQMSTLTCRWTPGHWLEVLCEIIYIESKNPPPPRFSDIFPERLEFFLHAHCTFLSTLEYQFLFNFLQLWWSYAILSAIIRSKCPPSAKMHAGWSHLAALNMA